MCLRQQKYMIESFFRIGMVTSAVRYVERWQSWLNARDSKSCILVYSIGGSNPFLSAKIILNQIFIKKLLFQGVFLLR